MTVAARKELRGGILLIFEGLMAWSGTCSNGAMVVNAVPFYSTVLSVLACLIPPYALRLARVFGTKRVGWVIFSVFVLLGALQLIRAWHPMGWCSRKRGLTTAGWWSGGQP